MYKEWNIIKEGHLSFVCRNAYRNSWPGTLLPKPLLMGYRQWPQSDRNMSFISSGKSRIHGPEQSPAPVSDVLLLIGLLMHQTLSEGRQVPPPQGPWSPAPVSERVRCVPTRLSWMQTSSLGWIPVPVLPPVCTMVWVL